MERVDKYFSLAREREYKQILASSRKTEEDVDLDTVTIIPVVIGATEEILKSPHKSLNILGFG